MLVWPVSLFVPKSLKFRPSLVSISGDVALDGTERFETRDGGGKWKATMSAVLWTLDKIRAAEAVEALAYGGVTIFEVPFWQYGAEPYPLGSAGGTVTHSDGSPFSDGAPYVSGTISITAAEDTALRSSTIKLNITVAGTIKGGEHFSISHNPPRGYSSEAGKRLYRIMQYDASTQIATIWPPLRAAVTAGTILDFDNPGLTMRLMNAETFMDDITPPIISQAQPQFTEAF